MRTPRLLIVASVAGAAALAPVAASAHSLESLQEDLVAKEKYFQPKEGKAPEFDLRDADGNAVRLSDLRGKVVVLNFVYASCPDVCPLHAELIADVQVKVNITPMKDRVAFVTVTTDPLRDGPQVLREYGEQHGLDQSNWTFLTKRHDQAEDATRKLALRYGHSFDESEGGFQVHGVVTHVIDQDGNLAASFHGLRFDPTNLVLFVNALTNVGMPHHEPEPTLWGRVLSVFE